MNARTELGERIAAWAELVGSLAELAAAIGVSRRTLTGLVRGDREPAAETVTLIAAWADVTPWTVTRWARSDAAGLAFPSPKARGGHARAERLTPERLREIAEMGARARWATREEEQECLPFACK